MLNFLRPGIARLLNPVGQALARTPVTPNMITVIGTVGVSGAALSLFPIGELFPGALIATIFVFTDMLDGLLARLKGSSGPFGAFLDSTMDRVGDASIFGGMVIWFFLGGHNTLLAIVTLFCLACGFLVSYVKARAQGLGLQCDVGLIERPERMLIGLTSVGLSGLGVPYVLPIGLWALAAGTLFTLGQRIRAVHQSAAAQAAGAAETGPAAGPDVTPESPSSPPSPPHQSAPGTPAAPATPTATNGAREAQ
jgi:CDP-diacylglycerol---glycerol-3-phosphate 3-phosphatidyltransferase